MERKKSAGVASVSVRGGERGHQGDLFIESLERASQDHENRLRAAHEVMERATSGREELSLIEAMDLTHLDKSQREEFASALSKMAELLAEVFPQAVDTADTKIEEPRSYSFDIADPEVSDLFRIFFRSAAGQVLGPDLADQARRASLMLMISSLETFVSSVAAALIAESPATVLLEAKELPLSLYQDLGTPQAAREYLAARAVESLMRESVEGWEKWFQRFEIALKEVPEDWWTFREIDARRNLLAHADGKVNGIYLSLARDHGIASELTEGSDIGVEIEYLKAAREELTSFGILLVCSVRLKWRGSSLDQTYGWGASQAEDLLDAGLDRGASTIAATLLRVAHGRLSRSLENRFRVISWVARMHIGGATEIREEVLAHDFSDLSLEISHMRSVLLEDDDQAVEDLKSLLQRGEITKTKILNSAIYKDLLSRAGRDWLVGTQATGEK